MFEIKIAITILISILIFCFMELQHRQKCKMADLEFKKVMKSLTDNAKREKEG